MKTCPVCKAQCFDDMTICYGCMYHFPDGTQSDESLQVLDQNQEDAAEQFPEEPPAAVINQVEAFSPDPPVEVATITKEPSVDQSAAFLDTEEECSAAACEAENESTPQTIVFPLEERGLEISIIVRPLGKGA